MKHILKFWSLAAMAVLCVSFSSCSKEEKEEEDAYDGKGYVEVTINGETYQRTYAKPFGPKEGMNSHGRNGAQTISSVAHENNSVAFYFYFRPANFKNLTVGEYKVYNGYLDKLWDQWSDFDLIIDGTLVDGYPVSGKNTVTNVQLSGVTDWGDDYDYVIENYLVEGNFTITFKDGEYSMSGKYWLKVNITELK
ncbi:MAG: hypothetical protein LBF59_04750 [Prevotellaceae bacterium]|jgi:hypothetical protein|nr:hypothetical protein [Prevotellaceae bacterium]